MTMVLFPLLKFQFPADETTTVFTFGAGVQWFEAYEAAKRRNRVIVGGISRRGSIGVAGGWLQGGGHSALSPSYGLGTQKHESPTEIVE